MNPSGSQSTIFVTGKVVLDDGTELTEPAMIQTICRGQRRTETYSDARGGFSFQFGDSNTGTADAVSDASSSNIGTSVIMQSRRNPRDCQLQAVLAGFTSEGVDLGSRGGLMDNIEVGRVPLHRLEHVEGTSISVTNALAPTAARKALEKARAYESKGKWEEARKSLDKAVEIYPRYAAAWNELGRLQLRDHDAPSARRSFEQALAADPKYVNPYDGLAQLAVLSRDWHIAVEVTNKLFALDPIDFPDAYFYNAAGNYYLGDLDAAEKSALQGVHVDEAHQVPKLQCLLGMILLRKQDYQAASEHMQLYLQMSTQSADVDVARKFLADIEKQSASAKPPSVEK
jgi:tetratricopeptide (TPR) repeat protein